MQSIVMDSLLGMAVVLLLVAIGITVAARKQHVTDAQEIKNLLAGLHLKHDVAQMAGKVAAQMAAQTPAPVPAVIQAAQAMTAAGVPLTDDLVRAAQLAAAAIPDAPKPPQAAP